MAEKQVYRFNNEIDTVEVDSISARIVIRENSEEIIYVEYDNPDDAPEFCAVLSGKTLTLKETLPLGKLFGVKHTEEHTISVFLPPLCYAKLKIKTASGGADIEGVTARDFDLNTASGEINVNAHFENIKTKSASGSVTLRNPTEKPAKTLAINTASGETAVKGYRAEKFAIHSVSGGISYDSASGEGEISMTSGRADVNYVDWCADLKISATSGHINITLPENSGAELKFDGMSGAVKTDLGNEKGKYMNLGKGTFGTFGGDNRHKISVSLTSGVVMVSQN